MPRLPSIVHSRAEERGVDTVRNDLVLSREPRGGRVARVRRDSDAMVDPVREEAPRGRAELHPSERPVRVERRDDRNACERQGRDADRRRHRLVQVQDIEALALERAFDRRYGARREDDVRERAVRRHDHGPPDRNHVRRWMPVAAEPRVQHARKAARRVVAHDRARLEAPPLQGVGLELHVLDDRSPERPRVRGDDADLHRRANVCAEVSNTGP